MRLRVGFSIARATILLLTPLWLTQAWGAGLYQNDAIVQVPRVICMASSPATGMAAEAPVKAVRLTFTGNQSKQVIAGVASTKIKVFAFDFLSDTAGVNLAFTEGTGTNCATNLSVVVDDIFQFALANQTISSGQGLTAAPYVTNTQANALCLRVSGAATITGNIRYCQE